MSSNNQNTTRFIFIAYISFDITTIFKKVNNLKVVFVDLIFMLLLLLMVIVYFYIRQKSKNNKLGELLKNITDINLSTNCFKNRLNVSIAGFSLFVIVLCLTATVFSPVFSGTSSAAENYVSSENTISQTSIFNYCTWQGEFTTHIGKYNTAPTGKRYAVVTLKINNTGDQTYSTNPNYWHLKIGDVYYQYDIATFDDSLHQLTADVGPAGKITVGIAYLVDRNLSISDIDMYYDGPGSDGIIGSNEGIKPVDSSTPNIFNYCILQGEFTTHIGKYNTAPVDQKYAVVTLKINNTGDQTYSTNPNYWHLKIGDIYYQYDVATFDASLHQLTAGIGPDGKITMEMAYLVDRNLSISDIDMYYDGPGSDGIIGSTYSVITEKTTISNPLVDFSANTTSGYAPLSVQFTDNSQNATKWNWIFGDGNTSKEKNPVHIYSAVGTYIVNLTASNTNVIGSKSATIAVSKKSVLPVVNFSNNLSEGYAPINIQFTDLSTNATSWNWDFGDGTTSNEQSPAHTYPSEGTFTVSLIASNADGNASHTATITVQSQSSSDSGSSDGDGSSGGSSHSSGGGGGGGAGGSPEPQSNVEIKELSQTFVGSGQSVKFDFPQKATPVVSVNFDSKKTTGKTTTIAEMLKSKSTLTSETPTSEVYKYLNIWVGSGGFGDSNNIENAIVSFRVEKSWIQDKNIDKSSITLNRYSDTKWNALSTKLSNEDDKCLYFTAETPGFSPFAITGEITANVKTTQSETQTGSNIGSLEKNTSNAANVEQPTEQTQTPSKKTPGFEAVYGIVGLLGVFLCRRR
jgi:PGF-pre-PGF domain-containing protein